jgi:hypothetical protein
MVMMVYELPPASHSRLIMKQAGQGVVKSMHLMDLHAGAYLCEVSERL